AALRDVQERSHWHVLGIRGEPSSGDIKKAYFAQSKQFHPDRFYGRNVGSFQKRLQAVFAGIKEAYDVLSHPVQGAEYRRTNPPPAGDVPDLEPTPPRFRTVAAPNEKQVDPATQQRLEARRQEILEERRHRRDRPAEERARQARLAFEEGLEQ